MRKAVLVTSIASDNLISRYLENEIIGLDGGIDIARQNGAKLSLAISTFENISLQYVLTFMRKDKIIRYKNNEEETPYLKVLNYLFSQGIEDIIILGEFDQNIEKVHDLLLTLKNAKGNVSFQSQNSMVTYYSKGSHIIMKQDYSRLYLIGFPQAVVSMEHVVKPVKNVKIDFAVNKSMENTILERVSVLKVSEGGVLLVLSKDD